MKPSISEGFSVGWFWLVIQSPYSLLVCLDFLFLHGSVSVGWMTLGTYLFLPCNLICWFIIVHVISYDTMHFCSVNYNFSSHFWFYLSYPFFLVSLAKGLSLLFIFLATQLLVSLTLSIVFLVSISFTSTLIFIICLLLLTLALMHSWFSISLRHKVRLIACELSHICI